MTKIKNKIRFFLKDVVDNRGKNPEKYFDHEKYPVIDNYLIDNKIYPDLSKVKRYINQKTYDSFLRKYLEKDDVLITLVGNGFCSVSLSPSNKVVIIQNTIGLQTNKKLDNKFLYYYLLLQQKNLIKLNRSSSQPSLNQQDLLDYEIEVPEKFEDQQKIASVLSTIDSKIELNNKINSELEAMAKTLYDYWFVQFDFPGENGKPYKSSGGKMVWNEELKRDIPEGWKVENLKKNSIATLIKPNIDKFEGEKIYLATADVEKNIININANKITYQKRESRANMQPSENSIWFAKMKNSKKILSFFDYSKEYLQNFVLSTGFAGLKCKKNAMEYLWNFINNQNFEFIKNRLANGATQEAINNDSMAFIPLIIPNKNTVDIYHEKTYDIYKKIYINQLENQKLAEIRDWLLPMLMNGQVKVTDDNK